MGKTANRQKAAKDDLDRKLQLSAPTRELLEELAIACAKDSSPHARFQYAFALSKSTEPSELRYAVTILDGMVAEGYEYQVDCMYGAATALYLLSDYEEARVRGTIVLCLTRKTCRKFRKYFRSTRFFFV
jgi:mitochondrial fission 1 protein